VSLYLLLSTTNYADKRIVSLFKFQGTINLFNQVLSIGNTTDSLNDTIDKIRLSLVSLYLFEKLIDAKKKYHFLLMNLWLKG
jgi:hypothetical protein